MVRKKVATTTSVEPSVTSDTVDTTVLPVVEQDVLIEPENTDGEYNLNTDSGTTEDNNTQQPTKENIEQTKEDDKIVQLRSEEVITDPVVYARKVLAQCKSKNLNPATAASKSKEDVNYMRDYVLYHGSRRPFDIANFNSYPPDGSHAVAALGLWAGSTPEEVRVFGDNIAEMHATINVSKDLLIVDVQDLIAIPNDTAIYIELRKALLEEEFKLVGVKDERGIQQYVLLTNDVFTSLRWL